MADLTNDNHASPEQQHLESMNPRRLMFEYLESRDIKYWEQAEKDIRERNKKGDIRPSDKHSIELLTYFINQQLD